MSVGKRKLKMKVTPSFPICKECPWKIWCGQLNFRVKDLAGKISKVCPVWWVLMSSLREKGIIKDKPKLPPQVPISGEERRAILEAARRKKYGMGGPSLA